MQERTLNDTEKNAVHAQNENSHVKYIKSPLP